MSKDNSYRQILRSSSIIGGASIINVAIGLIRTKLAAMLLGPAGIGLIGLYTNVVGTATTVAGLGFGNVGTRQIAEAAGTGDLQKIATARRALFWGTLALAVMGALAFWLLRHQISVHVLAMPVLAGEVGWLALGVALTVAAASQNALLRGLRRVGDIARVSVGSALLSTVLGVSSLLLWGRNGLLVYVLVAPLASFLLGHWFVRRVPKLKTESPPSLRDMAGQWSVMARVGFAFMAAGLAGTVGALVVRSLVQRELGAPALGHFQAAWAISMQYIGFVLGAMGSDFYPRLTAVIKDPSKANSLVNDQMEVALLLAAPIILALMGLAPWVVRLLYSAEFDGAVAVLRWQLLGDILKLVSWPLAFTILASGDGRTHFLAEWSATFVFIGGTVVLLPLLGLAATGLAWLTMYVVYLSTQCFLARRRIAFRWRSEVLLAVILLFALSLGIAFISRISPSAGAFVALIASGSAGLYSIRQLRAKGALPRRVELMLEKLGVGP